MNANDRIIEALFRAIDELNQTLPPDKKVTRSLYAELAGPSGALDSLGLVNLVVEAEQQIEATFGVLINLADERAVTVEPSPYKSVASLSEYIYFLLKEQEVA